MGQDSTTAGAAGTGLFAGEAWFDPIEAGIRDRVRGFIEDLLEQELTQALGRSRTNGRQLSQRATGTGPARASFSALLARWRSAFRALG
jgi:hypothetical protein